MKSLKKQIAEREKRIISNKRRLSKEANQIRLSVYQRIATPWGLLAGFAVGFLVVYPKRTIKKKPVSSLPIVSLLTLGLKLTNRFL